MSNPNPDTSGLAPPFKKGQSGNPGGKSKQQRQNEVKAAELASQLTLKVMEGLVDRGVDDLLASDVLNYIKEAQSRAHGTPKQQVDHTSTDGSMTPGPQKIELVAKQPPKE